MFLEAGIYQSGVCIIHCLEVSLSNEQDNTYELTLVWLDIMKRHSYKEYLTELGHPETINMWEKRLDDNCPTVKGKKVKVQVYSLFSSISSDFYIFTPWSLDLFIRVPFQLQGEHTVLQPFRHIELIIHITISVLPGTHSHLRQVKNLRVKCLAQVHNIGTMSQY